MLTELDIKKRFLSLELAVIYSETDVAKMREIRRTYRAVKNKAAE